MSKELDILIVEDVPADAEAIEKELRAESLRFKARRSDSRDQFLQELSRAKPDLILSDFSLPNFDALEALSLLRELQTDIPFILVTGTRSEEVAVECIRHGADDYILKASLKRLASSIQNTLRKKAAERRRAEAEAALRRSEEQFRHIAEHSRDLICLVDLHGRFLYASPSFAATLGYDGADLVGSSGLDLIHAEDRTPLEILWKQAYKAREGHTAEFRVRHRNTQWRVVECSASWVLDEHGRPQRSVLLGRDVTRRKQDEESLRGLPRLIRDAQEAERRRVARELHDGVIQILSSVKFRLQSIEEALAASAPELNLDAARAAGLLEKAIREVRHISRNLRPGELDDLGLVPAIRTLYESFQERTGVAVRASFGRLPESLSKDTELNVYRIVQEALANIEKHAQARRVTLSLRAEGPLLLAVIADDGRGMPASPRPGNPAVSRGKSRTKPGMGLVDIRERATIAGGSCDIVSIPGQGTEIRLRIPLPCPASPKGKSSDKVKKKKNKTAPRG